jgi:hypothetical protein
MPTVAATCAFVEDGESVLIMACESTEPAKNPYLLRLVGKFQL